MEAWPAVRAVGRMRDVIRFWLYFNGGAQWLVDEGIRGVQGEESKMILRCLP